MACVKAILKTIQARSLLFLFSQQVAILISRGLNDGFTLWVDRILDLQTSRGIRMYAKTIFQKVQTSIIERWVSYIISSTKLSWASQALSTCCSCSTAQGMKLWATSLLSTKASAVLGGCVGTYPMSSLVIEKQKLVCVAAALSLSIKWGLIDRGCTSDG